MRTETKACSTTSTTRTPLAGGAAVLLLGLLLIPNPFRSTSADETEATTEALSTEAPDTAPAPSEVQKSADEEHAALFLENRFPAATTCATCHP
ncbi:MAG: hypothetical protein AAF657_39220, partial [Acidobacteriota bacterium]